MHPTASASQASKANTNCSSFVVLAQSSMKTSYALSAFLSLYLRQKKKARELITNACGAASMLLLGSCCLLFSFYFVHFLNTDSPSQKVVIKDKSKFNFVSILFWEDKTCLIDLACCLGLSLWLLFRPKIMTVYNNFLC